MTDKTKMPIEFDRKIDIGHVITFIVMFVGFAVQYGALSSRVSAVEAQVVKSAEISQTLTMTLNMLQNTIIKVQTQMDERERRFDSRQDRQDERDSRQSVQDHK